MKTRSFTIALALAASSLSLAPAALAGDNDERSSTVSHSDLDLSTEEGIEELDRRIDRAARTVCGSDDPSLGTRIRDRETRRCMANVTRRLNQRFAQIIEDAQSPELALQE